MIKKLAFIFVILGSAIPGFAQRAPTAGNLAQFTVVPQGNFQTAYQNVPYVGSVSCQNGTLPCTYVVTGLPTGITQTGTTGSFPGTPTGSGPSTVTITATDSASPAHHATITPTITVATLVTPFITVGPTGQTIPTGTTGFQMNAAGTWSNSCPATGTNACPNINTLVTWAPVTFGTGGTLGLHTGVLAAGSAALTVNVTAAFNSQTSAADPVIITSSTPVISNGSLPNGQINQVYPRSGSPAGSNQLTCNPSNAGTTFALASGALPTGFPALPASGLVGGTATAAGTFTPAFTCTTSAVTSPSKTLNIVIESLATISALSPPAPTVAQFGTQAFLATCNYSGPSSAPCQPASGVGTITATGCGANANNSTSVATLASTPTCSKNVGDVTVDTYFSDNATTPPYTVPTDTAGNTAVASTSQLCVGGASDRCGRMYYMPTTTASAADTDTAHYGTATFPVALTEVKLIGAAASPLDQNGTSNDGGVVANQATSASITPTVGNTMAIFTVAVNGPGRTFTAGTGCTLLVTDPLGFMASESCPIAGTAATTEQMSWNGAATGWNGFISNYKPAAGGSGLMFKATDMSAPNGPVASIDPNTGIATALNAGTSNIQACIGATCSPNDLMTVTAATDTSVTTACPSNVNVGSGGQCTATGHPSGTVYVTGVSWSTSNAAVLTVNQSGVIQGIANGTATITAQLDSGVSGTSGPVTVSTQGTGALLTGATVLTDNTNGALSTISQSVPATWTLYWARGFEGANGSMSAPEQNHNSNGGGVTPTQFHSGGHSFGGLYKSNGDSVQYAICGSIYTSAGNTCGASAGLGSFSEIYISYWEYNDTGAYFSNSDFFWGGIALQNVCGQVQDVQLDAQFGGNLSTLNANMVVIGEGSTASSAWPACEGFYQYANQHRMTMNQGAWQQIEMHIVPSTTVSSPFSCTQINNSGSDCVGNGSIDVWLNGNNIIHITNADLNGTTNMAGADVGVGGVITACTPDGSCSPGCVNFQATCPGPVPGSGAPNAFNRYFDDVIVLKK